MTPDSALPTDHLLVLLDSEAGDGSGTDILRGFVIDVTQDLRDRIDEAHALLVEKPHLHSICLSLMGLPVAGREGRALGEIKMDPAAEAQLDALFAALEEENTRSITVQERAAFEEVEYANTGGERLVVFAHRAPEVMLHECGGYEGYRSRVIHELMPTALAAAHRAYREASAPSLAAAA